MNAGVDMGEVDRLARLEGQLFDAAAHGIENDARLQAINDRLSLVEKKMELDADKVNARFDSLDAKIDKIVKFPWFDPRGIVVIVSLVLGGSGFATSLFSGSTPAQAATQASAVMQTMDPVVQALIDKLAPVPAVPQDPAGPPTRTTSKPK